jgi:HD-GYP domain-containing protein (c-di-GMP phosphodiesterase class II)
MRSHELTKGTLDDRARAEIESHVEETFQFVDQIPLTEDLKNLASYAYGHHEKLNGSGYPRRLKGEAIPLQTRMITLGHLRRAHSQGGLAPFLTPSLPTPLA